MKPCACLSPGLVPMLVNAAVVGESFVARRGQQDVRRDFVVMAMIDCAY